MVDIATLTGAATLGLSRHYAALYSDDDLLAAGLVDAGKRSGDALWRMPLVAQYRRYLESDIADVAQTPTDPVLRAGSITAALYLQRFVGDVLWAHIDMAGPGRADKPRGEHPVGATGFGARLLTEWLRHGDLAALA
jgi:leucyl aminopeptidase